MAREGKQTGRAEFAFMGWRFALASILLLFFLVGAGFNLRCWVRRERGEGGASLLPGLAGAAGVVLWPIPHRAWLAGLPLVLDMGCLPYLVLGSVSLAHEAYVHRRGALVKRLAGRGADGVESDLSLYQNGDCILVQTNLPPPALRLSLAGDWQPEPDALVLHLVGKTVRLEADENGLHYDWSARSDVGLLDGVRLDVR
jgi:hypothetical protein